MANLARFSRLGFYAPAMRRDEVIITEWHDSQQDERARLMPHTFFDDPTAPPDSLPRKSIELRTLACFPE